jgi:hypothetical protein
VLRTGFPFGIISRAYWSHVCQPLIHNQISKENVSFWSDPDPNFLGPDPDVFKSRIQIRSKQSGSATPGWHTGCHFCPSAARKILILFCVGTQDKNGVLCAYDKYLLISCVEQLQKELFVLCSQILHWHTGYQSDIRGLAHWIPGMR